MDDIDDDSLRRSIRSLSAVGAIVEAQRAAVESAMRPYREILRVQDEIRRKTTEPFTAAIRAQQEITAKLAQSYSAIFSAQREISRSLTRSLIEPIASVLSIQRKLSQSIFAPIANVAEITKRIAEISGIAAQVGNLVQLDSAIDFKALIAAAVREAEQEDDEQTARNSIFAGYEGDEFLSQREAIQGELAKIPQFNAMPVHAQFIQVLNIAVQHPSSDVKNFALGMASNLLATILGGAYAVYWLAFFLVLVVMSQINSKLRISKTRQMLRTIPIDRQHTRLIECRCTVFKRPKSKAARVAAVELGTVVTILNKTQHWREIHFIDSDGLQRVGWVRAKYLRKV